MNDTFLQSALREWRSHMATPMPLFFMVAIALVLAIAAPFETSEILSPVPRFGYWLATVIFSYVAGLLVHLAIAAAAPRPMSRFVRVLVEGTATGIAVIGVIFLLNAVLLGFIPSMAQLPGFLGSVFAIAFVIAIIFDAIGQRIEQTEPTTARATILDRLPYDNRGALMALSVEDHYVRIQTSKGNEMVLLRLSDAMREVGDVRGLHVHRSHWVALDAIAKAARKGDGGVLTLKNGSEIPVSRSNMAQIKEAGLLPKSNG